MYKCNIPRESYGGLCAVKIVKIEPQYTRSRKVSLLPLWCFLLRKRQVFSFTVYCCIKKFVYYFKWYLSSNSQIINLFWKFTSFEIPGGDATQKWNQYFENNQTRPSCGLLWKRWERQSSPSIYGIDDRGKFKEEKH